MLADPYTDLGLVLVAGGDQVLRRALKLLLQVNGQRVSLMSGEPDVNERLPASTRVLIIAPGIKESDRRKLLYLTRPEIAGERIPVLELAIEASPTVDSDRHRVLPWPCRFETLIAQIEELLSKKH